MKVTGILHSHSTYSYDAKLSLRELKALCQKNGLQFICMTEHVDELDATRAQAFVEECAALSDESFCIIPGFEVPYRSAHILMIGAREYLGKYAPSLDALKEWSERAPFVVLAHPVRNHFMVEDGLLEQIDAIEVWNQQYEGKLVPRVRSLKLYDALKQKKQTLLATGGVDFHRTEHMGAPLTHLSVEVLREEAILEKLKIGAFTIVSTHANLYGTLPNAEELVRLHRLRSHLSVTIIVLGKFVNKILAAVGVSLPKSLKQFIRKSI